MTEAMQYATPGERRIARKLISTLIQSGYVVDINDGEEWTVRGSVNKAELLEALATTGGDLVAFRRHGETRRLGWFNLIWGNAEDGSELLSDHSDNDTATAIYAATYGEQA